MGDLFRRKHPKRMMDLEVADIKEFEDKVAPFEGAYFKEEQREKKKKKAEAYPKIVEQVFGGASVSSTTWPGHPGKAHIVKHRVRITQNCVLNNTVLTPGTHIDVSENDLDKLMSWHCVSYLQELHPLPDDAMVNVTLTRACDRGREGDVVTENLRDARQLYFSGYGDVRDPYLGEMVKVRVAYRMFVLRGNEYEHGDMIDLPRFMVWRYLRDGAVVEIDEEQAQQVREAEVREASPVTTVEPSRATPSIRLALNQEFRLNGRNAVVSRIERYMEGSGGYREKYEIDVFDAVPVEVGTRVDRYIVNETVTDLDDEFERVDRVWSDGTRDGLQRYRGGGSVTARWSS